MALSWRLALLCRPDSTRTTQPQSDALLNAWARERCQGVDKATRLTAANGFFLQNKSKTLTTAVWFVSGILDYLPRVRSTILQNHFSDAAGFIGVDNGFFLGAQGGGGKAAQVFAKGANRSIQLSDGFFWTGAALTLLLLHQPSLDEYSDIVRVIKRAKLSFCLLADRVIILGRDSSSVDFPGDTPGLDWAVLTPATAEELGAAGVETRPLYDPGAFRKRFHAQTKYALMRSDFIIFSQAQTLEAVEAQLAWAEEMVAGV
ncbi:hypothetical protein ColTof4_03123 [Colletotrichum tofieldiae]|nr:hypothetical protein ColTof4_03123 [Colletotrichum tofieldiae]